VPPELAKAMQVSQSLINYHLRVLVKCECVEVAATRERHGRPTRFYTATPGIILSAPHLELARDAPPVMADSSLAAFAANACSALGAGDSAATTFAVETLTLTAPHRLTAHQALRLTVANLRGLHEQSRQLNIATDALLVPIEVGIAMFEAPQP
jgi:Bacterial regulatory protein, arsR family